MKLKSINGRALNSILNFLYASFFLLNYESAHGAPDSIQKIFDELAGKNIEIKTSQLNTSFSYENLNGSLSRLYPNLSLSLSANKGDGTNVSSPNVDSGADSSGDNLGNQSTSAGNLSNVSDGWAAQASLGYFIFTGFAITEDIKSSRNSLQKAKNTESEVIDKKKSQLLQLLMEWQILNKVNGPINEASEMINKVKRFSKKQASMLYSKKDRLSLEEKSASIEYHRTKVVEGRHMVLSALQKLLPSLSEERLNKLPPVNVTYPVPDKEKMESEYKNNSRSYKNSTLDLENAIGYQRVSKWKTRSWAPTIYWSASYSQSGNYDGDSNDGGSSTGLVLSFNLFDGFFSSARLQQANISVDMAKNKRQIEMDKYVLYLKRMRMKSKVALAEFKMLDTKARQKKLRYLDLQRKRKQGIGSRLETSLGSLAFVKSKLEALNALKDHQQALLSLAVDLNQFNKVEIHAVPH